MPIAAIHKPTNTYHVADDESQGTLLQLRQEAADSNEPTPFVCRHCGEPMIFKRQGYRNGYDVVPHFAHKSSECTSDYASHPESKEHMAAKQFLYKRWAEEYPMYQEAVCEVEYRIPAIKRIADIAFVFPDGDIVIHEAQLSPISLEEIKQRTLDYVSIGAQVIWHFGPRMYHRRDVMNWCKEAMGVVGKLDFNVSEERTIINSDHGGASFDAAH